jgi:hypothetical protein
MPDDILVIGGSGNPKLMRKIGELPSRAVMIRATGLEELWALRVLAEISSHRDPQDTETADASYRQAMALAGELGMRPLVAHCHLGLGKRYRRTGQREQAQEHLTTATTMYREMGMTYWLEQAVNERG